MDYLLKEFIKILSQIKALYDCLVELSSEKKAVLIKNDIEGLQEIMSKEQIALNEIKKLEKTREEQLNAIAQKADMNDVGLDELIELAQGDISSSLKNLKQDMVDSVLKLSKYNSVNAELIKTHLEYTRFSLDMLTKNTVTPGEYDNSGYMKENSKSRIGLIDQKA